VDDLLERVPITYHYSVKQNRIWGIMAGLAALYTGVVFISWVLGVAPLANPSWYIIMTLGYGAGAGLLLYRSSERGTAHCLERSGIRFKQNTVIPWSHICEVTLNESENGPYVRVFLNKDKADSAASFGTPLLKNLIRVGQAHEDLHLDFIEASEQQVADEINRLVVAMSSKIDH
jgi:hypothetical protein